MRRRRRRAPHALLRLTLPGVDVGADAWPAGEGVAGYIELWMWTYNAGDIQTVFRIEGTQAQPYAPRRRPTLPGTLVEVRAAQRLPIVQ